MTACTRFNQSVFAAMCCWTHCCCTLVQIPSNSAFWSGNSKSSRSFVSGLSSDSSGMSKPRVVGAGRLWCCPRNPDKMHRRKYFQYMYMMPICMAYTWHMTWRKAPCVHKMSYFWYINDIYQIYDSQRCHISGKYQMYTWHKHGLRFMSSYLMFRPDIFWYILGIYQVYTNYIRITKRIYQVYTYDMLCWYLYTWSLSPC